MKTANEIINALQSTPRVELHLADVGTAKVVAAKNKFRNGFAILVVSSNGEFYGAGSGFKTRPSKSALASAIEYAKAYITLHGIA